MLSANSSTQSQITRDGLRNNRSVADELRKLRHLDKLIEESLKVSSECRDRRMTI